MWNVREVSCRAARLACLVVLMTGLAQTAGASTIAVQTANSPLLQTWIQFAGANSSATVGWSFTVGSADLTLTDLGVFDDGGNGLLQSHQVGLWTSGGALLASATVPAGTAGTLDGSYRFVSAGPTTLVAGGQYVIGAFYEAGTNDSILILSSQTFASEISYSASLQTNLRFGPGGSLAFPTVDAGVAQGLFGPNFRFTTAQAPPTVPEPALLTLLGVGLTAVVTGRRRRRSRRQAP